MDFYYEVGSRHALKVLLLLEFCPHLKVNLKELSQLENRESSLAAHYQTLLVVNDRTELFEPYAIMRYLASEAKVLYGENIEERCLIDQWISHLQATFLVPLGQFYDIVLGRKMVTRSRYLALNHEIKQHLQQLDSRVKIQSFLCGTYMSLADLSLACDLFLAYRLVITDKYKKNISYLMKWYERVSRKEEFQRVFGHEWPCKKQLIPEHFLLEDNIVSDNSILNHKKESFSVFQSEEALPQLDPLAPKRNQLAFDYFRELVQSGEDRKLKIGLFWTVFDMMNCTLWKFQFSPKEPTSETTDALHNIFLEAADKLKQNFAEDEFGWFGIYGQPTKQIKGVFCLSTTEVPSYLKTEPSLAKFEAGRLNPHTESERQLIEEHWCNVIPGQLCQHEKVVATSFLSH